MLVGAGAVVVAALVAVTVTLAPWKTGTGGTRTPTPTPTPRNLTWFDSLGLPMRSGWTVAETESGTHVLTGPCTDPKASFFRTPCNGFWVMGAKQINTAAHGFGSYLAGKQMYYPASDVEPCPAFPADFIVTPDKPVVTEQRQLGGRPATYSEYAVNCAEQNGAHRTTSGYTEREWYVADRQILVIDVTSDPDLPEVLAKASWR